MKARSTSNFIVERYKVSGYFFGLGAMSLTTANKLKDQLVSECSVKELSSLKAGGNSQAEFFKQLNIILVLITFVATALLTPFSHFLQSASKEADWNHESRIILTKEKLDQLEEDDIEGKKNILESVMEEQSKVYAAFTMQVYQAYIDIVFIVVLPIIFVLAILLSRYKFLLSLSFCLDAAYEEKKRELEEQKERVKIRKERLAFK